MILSSVRWSAALTGALMMVTTVAALPAAAVPAGSATEGGSAQRFVLVATDTGGVGRLVATGPISGVGTDTLLDHTAEPDGTFTDRDRFDLPVGTVVLRDTYTATVTADPRTCVSTIAVAGRYTITDGTGAYAGATGAGTFTARGVLVAGRDGAGACLGPDAPPRAFAEVVHATGTTRLG